MRTLPFVSVIIPVRNNSQGIAQTLHALEKQTYPKTRYEILVIDNNSTDATEETIQTFDVQMYKEKKKGAYAARNAGLQHAKGEIFAFTDADCMPSAQWIAEGVQALKECSADLAGGAIQFTFTKHSAAEIADSLIYLQQQELIKKRNSACTANLFLKKTVIDAIGYFDEELSDGDTQLTRAAVRAGFTLIYAPKACIKHEARSFWPLIKKTHRIGRTKGIRLILPKAETKGTVRKWSPIILERLHPGTLRKKLQKRGNPEHSKKYISVLCMCYLIAVIGALSIGYGICIGMSRRR